MVRVMSVIEFASAATIASAQGKDERQANADSNSIEIHGVGTWDSKLTSSMYTGPHM